jgi:hypothetical protein
MIKDKIFISEMPFINSPEIWKKRKYPFKKK